MKRNLNLSAILIVFFLTAFPVWASNNDSTTEEIDVKEFISHHLADAYEWQIVSDGKKHIAIPLPVILYSKTTGWNIFLSSHFQHGTTTYNGFMIATEGKYKGKIVAYDNHGEYSRPLDLSLTKNAAALLIAALLVILIIMGVARIISRDPLKPRKGFVGLIEMVILSVNDDVIKPSIGKDWQRYAPYLLTLFFFIFINNLLGLIPVFPGGANVTGNIAVTMVLALSTFLVVNFSGNKAYYKDIFWPEVPTWLKVPFPLMPIVEIVGIFTKPFALMIRLFANILAGHSIILGLTMIIFITVGMGTVINSSMSFLSIVFTVFIYCLELLIAYIQAYIFTLLSAVFIGLARMDSLIEKKNHIDPVQPQ